MKKILLAVGLMFASVCAFANVEIDVNLYGMGKALSAETTDDDKNKSDIYQSFAFGFEDDFNFFFGSNASKFDAGLGFFINCDFFKKAEVKYTGGSFDYEGNGFNMEFGIGPVFRITFANPFSLYIRPTLGFDFFYIETDDIKDTSSGYTVTYKNRIAEFDILKFDVNVGGRSWLLNVDGFHLGIDYGAILGFGGGFGATSTTQSGYSGNSFTSADVDFKLYVGCCMNFGDRGFDR